MTNRTARTEAAEIALARRHRAEHDEFQARLEEVGVEIGRLNAAIIERNNEIDRAGSQAFRTILQEEVAQLERQLAERGAEQQDILQQLGALRGRVDNVEGRVGTLENRTTCLRGDVDGLQGQIEGVTARSTAHATAISQLQAANGWVPMAAAAVAGFITYVAIELFRAETATHIQWAWTLAVTAVVGLIASLLTGEGRINSASSATAAAGAGTTPADQPVTTTQLVATPVPAGQVTPPPPPTQFPTVQAAAAAAAQAN